MLNAGKSKIKVLADLVSVKRLISGLYRGLLAVSKPGKRSKGVLPGLIRKGTDPTHEGSSTLMICSPPLITLWQKDQHGLTF